MPAPGSWDTPSLTLPINRAPPRSPPSDLHRTPVPAASPTAHTGGPPGASAPVGPYKNGQGDRVA